MSYEFQSTLYPTSSDMHAHIAKAYMTAGGLNDDAVVRRFFAEYSNEDLADEAIKQWGLSDNPDFDRAEFLSALADLRNAQLRSNGVSHG